MDPAADLTPEEFQRALADLRAQYGDHGLKPIRVGASIMIQGAVYEARPLAEAPPGLPCRCFFCDRSYPSEADYRRAHIDKHGVKARREVHLFGHWSPEAGLFTDGPPMEAP